MEGKNIDPLKMESYKNNPWLAEDVSFFLRYCCPECNYTDPELLEFTNHALGNHKNSAAMFTEVETQNIKIEHDYSKTDLNSALPGSDNFDPGLVKIENKEKSLRFQTENTLSIEDRDDSKAVIPFKILTDKETGKITKLYSCPHCEFASRYLDSLQRHIDSKHPEHDVKNFFCDTCDKSFIYKCSLVAHTRFHRLNTEAENRPKLVCDQCDYSTKLESSLKQHIRNIHNADRSNVHSCTHCEFESRYLDSLQRHIDSKHPEHDNKKFFCDTCDKSFIYKNSLVAHARFHRLNSDAENRPKLVCDQCDYSTKLESSLKQHIKNIHDAEQSNVHSCTHCEFESRYLESLYRHIDSKHPEHDSKKFFCDTCDKSFIYKNSLVAHARFHRLNSEAENRPKLVCDQCDYSTILESLLKIHMRNKHDPEKVKKCHMCPYCNETKSSLNIWKRHIDRMHPEHDEKKFICEKCSMGFIFEASLTAHICEKIKCLNCDFSTIHAQYLRFHMKREHENKKCKKCKKKLHGGPCVGDEKLKCKQCNSAFKTDVSLREHVLSVHEKRKDFTCEFCGKHFVTQRRCNGHVTKTHTQKRLEKVKCDICNKTLCNLRQLQNHKVFVHNNTENVWICDICPMGAGKPKSIFSSQIAFENHVETEKHMKNVK